MHCNNLLTVKLPNQCHVSPRFVIFDGELVTRFLVRPFPQQQRARGLSNIDPNMNMLVYMQSVCYNDERNKNIMQYVSKLISY